MHANQGLFPRVAKVAGGAIGVVLIAYVGFLLASEYRSQVALRLARLTELNRVLERRATVFHYFLQERQDDLSHLAGSREVSIWFENQALEMSMEYGLRASLVNVEDLFGRIRQSRRLGDVPVYARIVLVDRLGGVVVFSGERPSEGGPGWAEWTRTEGPIRLAASREGVTPHVVVSVPVSFRDLPSGRIVAWIPLPPVFPHFVGEISTVAPTAIAMGTAYLFLPEPSRRSLPPSLRLAPPRIPPGTPVPVPADGPDAGRFLGLRVRVEGTPFALVSFVPAAAEHDQEAPRKVLLSSAAIAALILAGAFAVGRLLVRNSILETRLQDTTEREREVEEKNREIGRLNAELEERVKSRTAQLEVVGREMEAFTYTVSHDLRAPLRAIDGFSARVVSGYGAVLDDEGRRLLGVVRASAQRMARLIDDLLAFSRVGRTELKVGTVDMETLAREVGDEVLGAGGSSRATLRIGPLPEALGDRALLRQVWQNLLSNAVKFSSRAGEPAVEVEGETDGAFAVYRVRDNGAGFDMAFAGKLFGVFSRLHDAREFEGVGVGLAIVQSIVTRLGGRVSATGAVGKGATFTFSLPLPAHPEA